MKYTAESQFPDKIDDLIFFEDITVEQKEDFNRYNEAVKEKKYNNANQIMDSSDANGYVGTLFNLMEQRIYAAQRYIVQKPEITYREILSDDKPINITNKTVWISSVQGNTPIVPYGGTNYAGDEVL